MLTRLFGLLTVLSAALGCQSQSLPERLKTNHPPLDEKLSRMVTPDTNAISPDEARKLTAPLFLDARETEEFEVSHLPGALPLGYDRPNFAALTGVEPERPLVVYCTIGYRSERMARRLRQRGFKRVYNLYGSIYAWSLAGLPLENADGEPTEMVHTYNRKWGQYYPIQNRKTY